MIIICICAVLAVGIWVHFDQQKQKRLQVTAGDSHDLGAGYRSLVYNGEKYRYNNLVTTVLYAGVDSTGKLEATRQYGNKARADSIALAVMNEKTGKLAILPINRDTMTKIRRYSLNGNDNGLYESHIGYAYSYGDGGKVSCENLCEAVSELLGGIPVREYVVTNQDSMPYINDLAGGITLTVPNSDLEEKYPEFYEGAEVTLDSESVHSFLQYRDTEEAYSNEGRMERQKAYASAYIRKVKAMSQTQMEEAWDSLDAMGDYLQTSITRSKYLKYAKLLKELDFSEDSYIHLEGADKEGELHDEFYPDEKALRETVLELFYEKA